MKILIIDNHVLFREGLASLLDSQPDMEVIGEAKSADDGVAETFELKPDLVLIDVISPKDESLLAVKSIHRQNPDIKVVILANHKSDDLLFAALRAGAMGYLLKNSSFENVIASLRALDRGEAALSRSMTRSVVEEFARLGGETTSHEQEELDKLTVREVDVLKLLTTDATNREIAENLFITENTVKIHVSNILEKLNLRNRREAANYARRQGLVPTPDDLRSYQSSELNNDR